MAEHSKKPYYVMFAVLTVLTLIEVGVAKLDVQGPKVALLVLLAVTKATLVALYYMHLKSEMRALKLVIVIPMLFPALYAVVLIIESMARSAFT